MSLQIRFSIVVCQGILRWDSFFLEVPFSNDLLTYELGSEHFGDDLRRPVRQLFQLVISDIVFGEVNDGGASAARAYLAVLSRITQPDVSLLRVFD